MFAKIIKKIVWGYFYISLHNRKVGHAECLGLVNNKEDVGLAYVIEKYNVRGVLVMII